MRKYDTIAFQKEEYKMYQYLYIERLLIMKEKLYMETSAVIEEICEKAKLKEGNILVIGCSK